MSEANPIVLVEELRTVLGRYIATTLPISRRYPRLAERFRHELQQQNLVDGPYVEALPDFEKGVSLNALLKRNGGFLNDALGVLPTANRALHRHQQLALEYAARDGKSLLVATGTGSGKTETFLYPIAHALLSDPEPEKPGVRALLIYPMNALANDQLYYRIAPLFGNYLARHSITFGRYTGQVKANTSHAEEESRLFENSKLMAVLDYPQHIPGNWMLTREEMLRDPPKVLITNYAMLEHLLLLPRNERLFSANALKCIVLDEIHTYHGAQATEVSFLLRKLKNRLGVNAPLQVFGTSASLADGADADEKLKAFARDLFGEEVHAVIRGKRIVHERLQRPTDREFSLSVQEWIRLGRVLEALAQLPETDRSTEMWHGYLEEHDLLRQNLQAAENEDLGPFLEKRFSENREARRVAALLDKPGVIHFSELAQRLFDSPLVTETAAERGQALSAVIRMGMVAQADKNGFPLLPGRYHLAVNGIEGVAVLPAADDEGWSQIRVARHHQSEEGRYYPLLVCRKCGQPYFEGYEESGHLHSRRPDHSDAAVERRVFWLGNTRRPRGRRGR
ncbi:Dbp (fragment) [Candidatus Accumulibacter aalborgensis]|uniref:Dbp n=1 Tax=Candidatus Accumulibacter aalborgensis TaxID=1860102 RepID=A0A1A8XVI2_9PROT